jgi:hypothetical protein
LLSTSTLPEFYLFWWVDLTVMVDLNTLIFLRGNNRGVSRGLTPIIEPPLCKLPFLVKPISLNEPVRKINWELYFLTLKFKKFNICYICDLLEVQHKQNCAVTLAGSAWNLHRGKGYIKVQTNCHALTRV